MNILQISIPLSNFLLFHSIAEFLTQKSPIISSTVTLAFPLFFTTDLPLFSYEDSLHVSPPNHFIYISERKTG